jgi:hypothetical protein
MPEAAPLSNRKWQAEHSNVRTMPEAESDADIGVVPHIGHVTAKSSVVCVAPYASFIYVFSDCALALSAGVELMSADAQPSILCIASEDTTLRGILIWKSPRTEDWTGLCFTEH